MHHTNPHTAAAAHVSASNTEKLKTQKTEVKTSVSEQRNKRKFAFLFSFCLSRRQSEDNKSVAEESANRNGAASLPKRIIQAKKKSSYVAMAKSKNKMVVLLSYQKQKNGRLMVVAAFLTAKDDV